MIPVEDARESGAPLRPDPIARIRELEPERISGPSFLGLAGSGQGGSDYLLEEPQRSTWRAWLVLIILVILGGLFYLQWRTNWRAQPHEAPPPPAAPATPSPTAPQGKASPPSDATGVPPTQTPQQANAAPADKQDNKATETKPPEKSAASTTSDDTGKGAKQADDQPDAADDSNPPSDEEAPASSKKAPRQPIAERGSADPTRADPGHDPMLYMAQKYLRGGGPGRNCDQAMVYLRAANEKASAPARSQMGALYATGTCVPLDRVRAYQWFTSALNLDPNNEDLRRERTNLWAQMSSDERQQAVK